MKNGRCFILCVLMVVVVLTIEGCGGGGGGANAGSKQPSWPSSGSYVPVLKPSGSTTASPLSVSLSLVHSSTPEVEYLIDTTAAPSQLGIVLYKGTYDTASCQFSGITPVAFLDAPNGTLRTTILLANGAKPKTMLGPTVALCSDYILASNYADPYASEIVVSSPGVDGQCGTSDDGTVLVRFNSDGSANINSYPNDAYSTSYLGFLRSADTGQPTYWLYTSPNGASSLFPTSVAATSYGVDTGTPGATNVKFAKVQHQGNNIFYMKNGALMGVTKSASGSPTKVVLSALTGPDGWKSAGNDETNIYVYLNSSTAASGAGTWRLLSISQSSLAVTTLATGSGSIYTASALPGAVYATVISAAGSTSSVLKIDTTSGAQTTYVAPASSSVSFVSRDSGGVSTLMTIPTLDQTNVSTTLIDDQGTSLYSMSPGMFYGADGSRFDTVSNTFLSSSLYLIAQSSSTGFGGRVLTRFDVSSKSAQTVGTLPLGDALGGTAAEKVFATAISRSAGISGLYLSRLSGSQLNASGGAVYTFTPGQANGLTKTTVQIQ